MICMIFGRDISILFRQLNLTEIFIYISRGKMIYSEISDQDYIEIEYSSCKGLCT